MTSLATRTGRLLAHDGRIAVWLLTIWQCFLAAIAFLATLSPFLLFQSLVGWQATHLAIALFGISLLPVIPGTYALLVATARVLDVGGEASAGKTFVRAFREASSSLRGVAIGAAVVAVVLSYDIALFAADDTTLLITVGAIAVVLAVFLAICVTATESDSRGLALVLQSVTLAARRPHIVLAWLFLAAIGGASAAAPLVGSSLMVFAPTLVALGIHVCNRALGFRPRTEQENL